MLADSIVIALAHSIPILVIRLCTASRVKLVVVAAVMAVIAVEIGESQYKIPALIAVGVAWYFCNKSIRGSRTTSPTLSVESAAQKSAIDSDSVISGIIIVAVVGLLYLHSFDKPKLWTTNTPFSESNLTSNHKPNPKLTGNQDSASSTRHPALKLSVSSRLRTIASEMNSGAPKPLGNHLTLLNAVANENSLSISIQINDYAASDANARTPLASGSITHYYCGLGTYRQLLNEGATFIVQLYGKDLRPIDTYSVTESICNT